MKYLKFPNMKLRERTNAAKRAGRRLINQVEKSTWQMVSTLKKWTRKSLLRVNQGINNLTQMIE